MGKHDIEDLRPLLTTYAYNVLGSYEDAKDTVQDVFLKFTTLEHHKINDEKSYLIRMVINLAIDKKEKYKKHLAAYPGHWLPEPVATDNPETPIARREILSYSLMVMLEKLDGTQRAVFILKEAYDYDHGEIAEILGITVENSRKILSRARKDLQSVSEPATVPMAWLEKYLAAMESEDMRQVEQLLMDDVTITSDGGGKAIAAINLIKGSKSVTAFLSGVYKKTFSMAHMKMGFVNHQPALFCYSEGKLVTCQIFDVKNDVINNLYFIRNPDKLRILENSF